MIATAYAVAFLGSRLLIDKQWPTEHPWVLAGLAGALVLRALAQYLQQLTGHRAATETIADLRRRLVEHSAAVGPRGRGADSASTAALATAGLENLRPYMTGYVPQLALAATVTPLALIVIATLDLTSALMACVAIPLIPIFMILIGQMTEGSSERSLVTMRTLWAQTLDLIEGLPTLRALGRDRGSEVLVQKLGEEHKASAMRTLAFAFLSSLALEIIATLGVALIAVSIGLRLVYGNMELFPAIAVLVLAAEVYLPLRMVGQQFHASTDGVAALDEAFHTLESPALPTGAHAPDLRTEAITLTDLTVPGRDSLAPAGLNATIQPGTIHALTGPSGCGKSTAILAILGLLPESTAVTVGEVSVPQLDQQAFWEQVTWLPQRPVVGPGTIREILTGPASSTEPRDHSDTELEHALRLTGLEDVIRTHGWDAMIGRGGHGLSMGQRQRVALTAALLRPRPLVILDEPTAHLDGASEQLVAGVITELKARGCTVLLTAHRTNLLAHADSVTAVASAPLTGESEVASPRSDGSRAGSPRADSQGVPA